MPNAARRAIAQRLPETVAAAVLEFCEAALAVNPQRGSGPSPPRPAPPAFSRSATIPMVSRDLTRVLNDQYPNEPETGLP
jgi:hypothetical protein